jgi:hypothetical protein
LDHPTAGFWSMYHPGKKGFGIAWRDRGNGPADVIGQRELSTDALTGGGMYGKALAKVIQRQPLLPLSIATW